MDRTGNWGRRLFGKLSSEPEFGSGIWICRSGAVCKPPVGAVRMQASSAKGYKWCAGLSTGISQSQLLGLLNKLLVHFKILTNLNIKY